MRHRVSVWLATATAAALLAGACGGGRQVEVLPPRVELAPFQRVGLVAFTTGNADPELGAFATRRFAEQLLNAQWGYELLELGEAAGAEAPGSGVDLARVRALGEEHELGALMVGRVVVSDVRPRASLMGGPRIAAEVSVELSVRLLAGASGGTLWARSARIRDTLAQASLAGGTLHLGVDDPEEVYGHLVDRLVHDVTRDFRSTTRRR